MFPLPALQVVAFVILASIIVEWILYLLCYNSAGFRNVKSMLDKRSKKLETLKNMNVATDKLKVLVSATHFPSRNFGLTHHSGQLGEPILS
jgi:hypothetical protein